MSTPYRVISAQPITTVNEFAITEDDIIDDGNGLPMASWSNTGTVVNKIDIQYNYNEDTKPLDFAKRVIYTAGTSVDRYTAQPPLLAECRGIHDDLGGEEILSRFALLYLQRWGYPPPILIFSITYRRHMFEAMDVVTLTHSKIANPISGVMGLANERMEILSVSPRWGLQGRMEITAVWIGAIESSAVPVVSASSLVPGESTVDSTDTNIPFASSITLTTPGGPCSQIRIGLKALNYRTWQCFFDDYIFSIGGGKEPVFTCDTFFGNFSDRHTYNTKVAYHMEYKVSSAPDAPGGGNPANGWVTLLDSSERGNTNLVGSSGCGAPGVVPAEDLWTHFFPQDMPGSPEILAGAPAVFNVKIYFDSVTTQGDPCPQFHSNCASQLACASFYTGSLLEVDQQRMTADFIEAIV